ncbi:transcription factor E2F5 [Stegastes partitus]|uniref:Transcription factor E2F5 n=1 Tax=Stegastes partitus TaxID=144197 RepID=A0A9Y4K9J2_9TELE|nr:PREDICTED: transcription factor E2F5 [Stegastes partitus]
MEFETTETVRSTPSRHEKSLGLLTMKFVSLLQEAKDGVLDLKVAADSLAVKQKRRIYDITNVLEGVGLIEKKNKNIIQWRGENTGSQTQEVLEQVKVLKAQISELQAQEKELDDQKAWLEENIKHLNRDPITSNYKFVTHEDICSAFSGDTLLAVIAPTGTQLEVPLPEMGQAGQKKYQVNLRSCSAPIQVMLINRDSDSTIPVVFPVPPTDNICPMPAPPRTPASLQRCPLSVSASSTFNTTTSYCSQDSLCSDHQVVLPVHELLTPSSTPPDVQIGKDMGFRIIHTIVFTFKEATINKICKPKVWLHSQIEALVDKCHSQQTDLAGPEFQSMLDVSSLLTLSAAGDHVKDDGEGCLSPHAGIDYSFNLDDNEGVCDLFDMQILNY